MSESAIGKTTLRLSLFAVTMFGFGYALVPIYNVFCDITGFNGKTGRISEEMAEVSTVDVNREIAVGFDTNIREMPWEFKALDRKVVVHPGELGEATFTVENKSGRDMVGRAIPSVAPTQASAYFNKTECFCFTEQFLAAGEKIEVKVRFIVDNKIPDRFSSLTLSYTFFELPQTGEVAGTRAQKQSSFLESNI